MRKKVFSLEARTIVRDFVYGFTSLKELAEIYGVSYSTMHRTIKRWKIEPPYHLTWPKGAGWQWAKNKLPIPGFLREINRSDFCRLYKSNTQTEFAKMFGVTRKTISNALMYHCIQRRSRQEAYQMLVDREHEISLREEQERMYERLAEIRRNVCRNCGRFTTDPVMCKTCEYRDSDLYNHLKYERKVHFSRNPLLL